MSIYDDFADDALDLLQGFDAASISISRSFGETHDAVTGLDSGGQIQKGRLTCVVLSANSAKTNGFDFDSDFEVLDKTRQRYVVASAKDADFQPEKGDQFGPFDGELWTVVGVNPISPTGTPVVYKFGIQR